MNDAWRERANCRPGVIPDVWQPYGEHPVDLFFPEGKGSMDGKRRAAIAEVCGPCPVKRQCREWGLYREEWGSWGGTTQGALHKERKGLRISAAVPEVDKDHRGQIIGTFYPGGHGSEQRYQRHLRVDGDIPCQACKEAHHQYVRPFKVATKEAARREQLRQVGTVDAASA